MVGATGTQQAMKGMVIDADLHKMREMDQENVTEGGSVSMEISPLSSNRSPFKRLTISSSSSSSSGGISDSGKIHIQHLTYTKKFCVAKCTNLK